MSDLISRAKAKKAIQKALCADKDFMSAIICEGIENVLNNLPSTEPEIIRCKDCKWYGRADKRRFYRGMDCLQKRIDTIIPDKDFCSRAERLEE